MGCLLSSTNIVTVNIDPQFLNIDPQYLNAEMAKRTITYNAIRGTALVFKPPSANFDIVSYDTCYKRYIHDYYQTDDIGIYVFDPVEIFGIRLKGRENYALRTFRNITISRALNTMIELEIEVDKILEKYASISDAFIYDSCRMKLLQGNNSYYTFPLDNFESASVIRTIKDFRGRHKVVIGTNNDKIITEIIPYGNYSYNTITPNGIKLISNKEYQILLDKIVDSESRISSRKILIVEFILDKVLNREYENPEIYRGLPISHVKRAN